jgi:hypothetical protein
MFFIVGGTAGAILGGAVIDAGGAMYASHQAAGASEEATAAYTASAEEANQTQWDMYQQSREDQMPWLEAGAGALADLETIMAEGPGEFTESSYYQQGLEEAQQATDAYMASRGLYASGKAGEELQQQAVDINAANRANWLDEWVATTLNPAQALAGAGQTAATTTGQAALATGSDIAQTTLAAGEARASGITGAASAGTEALQSGANALADYYGSLPGSGTGGSNVPEANIGNSLRTTDQYAYI